MRFPHTLPFVIPVLTLGCQKAAQIEPFNQNRSQRPPQLTEEQYASLAAELESEHGRDLMPSGAFHAHRWRRLGWMSEDGSIPRGVWLRAVQERAAVAVVSEQDRLVRDTGQRGGLDPLTWQARGPDNVGGRTRSLLTDPRDPDWLLAGSVSGGLWQSYDAGDTWEVVNDVMQNLAVGCLVRDPNNLDVIYCGTGEAYFNIDFIHGIGILKSTDNGKSWELMPGTEFFDNTASISIHPTNSQILLAGTRYGGIMRSEDGGQTWENPMIIKGSFKVLFDPANGDNAVAHIIDYDYLVSDWYHSAYYSRDSGRTWIQSAGLDQMWGFNSRIELAYAPSNTNIVYANCAADGGKVWRSDDGGKTYVQQTTTDTIGSNWYACPMWVDPVNPDIVVVGSYYAYKSRDKGKTLEQITFGYILTEDPHPDIHGLVTDVRYDGVNNRTAYLLTDGGIFRTQDLYSAYGSSGWSSKNDGYQTAQYYGADGAALNGLLVGGTQDNGTLRHLEGNNDVSLTFGGDGGFTKVDWVDPNYVYGEHVFLQVHRSFNGGAWSDWMYSGLGDAGNSANFIAPLELDPNDPNRLYAGGTSLWVCDNARSFFYEWRSIKGPGSDRISAIAVRLGNPDEVWIGCNDGEIWRTENATADTPNWFAVDDNNATDPLPDRYVTRIVLDHHAVNRAYVAFGGFERGNVRMTKDNGQSFHVVTGGGERRLPTAPVRGLCLHPNEPGWIYAGTEVGLFESKDGGLSWSTDNIGPANVSIDEVVFLKGSETLLIATHGRGLWTAVAHGGTLKLWAPDEVVAGGQADLGTSGGHAGQAVAYFASQQGVGTWQSPHGFTLDLAAPVTPVWQTISDVDGNSNVTLPIPGHLSGTSVWLQAAEQQSGGEFHLSKVVKIQVQ